MKYDEEEYVEQCRDAAEPALDYYNTHIAPYDDGGITYEMVDLGMSTTFGIPMQPGYKLHSNFIAKPHYSSVGGDSSAPHMLFFAEVWEAIYPDPTFAVLCCRRLGPDVMFLLVVTAAGLVLNLRILSIILLMGALMLALPLVCSLSFHFHLIPCFIFGMYDQSIKVDLNS